MNEDISATPQQSSPSPMAKTKLKLFLTALDLFSTKGFAGVGVREIAAVLHIKSGSIYHHFASKDEILDAIYQYFYDNYKIKHIDTLTLIGMIPSTPPQEIFELLLLPFGGEAAYDTMRKVLSVAIARSTCDPRAEAIVSEVFFVTAEKITLVLNRMLEFDLIEPVDAALFASVYISTSLSATLMLGGKHAVTYKRWRDGRMLLLSLIRKKSAASEYQKDEKSSTET